MYTVSFFFPFFSSSSLHIFWIQCIHTHVYTIHIYSMLYWISRAHIHTTMLYCIARQCLRCKTFVFCCTFCETEKILKCSLSLSLRCLLSVPQLTLQAESYKISRLSWCRFVKLISIVRHQVLISRNARTSWNWFNARNMTCDILLFQFGRKKTNVKSMFWKRREKKIFNLFVPRATFVQYLCAIGIQFFFSLCFYL